MLSIKKSLRSYIPEFHAGISHMEFSPVVSEPDELIQAIEEDVIRHDDNWTLEATPDTETLEQSWDDILREPEWSRDGE